MDKIINGKKYDTKTATLVAIYKNKWLQKYELETEEEFILPRDEVKEEPEEPENPFLPGAPVFPLPGTEEEEDPYPIMPLGDLEEDEYEDLDDPDTPRQDPDPKEEEEEEEPEEPEPNEPKGDDEDDDPDGDDDPNEDDPSEEDPTPGPDLGSDIWDEMPEEVEPPKLSPMWLAELLYKKDSGKYFLYGVGGAASDYWNHKNGKFIPFDSEEEAIEWAIERLTVKQVEELFGGFYE